MSSNVLTIHSSWNHHPGKVMAAGWMEMYFVDEHPKRTQWSRHTTCSWMSPNGIYITHETWITMPKGLQLSKWFYDGVPE